MTSHSLITGPCPSCGTVAARTTYDIGSGPELSCADCEWCWGAEGQDLKPLNLADVQEHIADARRAAEGTTT